jgi:hypothetical protein
MYKYNSPLGQLLMITGYGQDKLQRNHTTRLTNSGSVVGLWQKLVNANLYFPVRALEIKVKTFFCTRKSKSSSLQQVTNYLS